MPQFVFAGVLIAAIGVAACSHDGSRSEASASGNHMQASAAKIARRRQNR